MTAPPVNSTVAPRPIQSPVLAGGGGGGGGGVGGGREAAVAETEVVGATGAVGLTSSRRSLS